MVTFTQDAKTWRKIHRKAARIRCDEDKEKFVRYMKRLYKVITCAVCKAHTKKFMRKHPMEEYWTYIDDDGRDRGLFRWTWIFHNDVNRRLGKERVRWHKAVKMYYKHY